MNDLENKRSKMSLKQVAELEEEILAGVKDLQGLVG